jgi:hypothetical protein
MSAGKVQIASPSARTIVCDKLIESDRAEVRDKLGPRTLAETDRTIAALRRACKDLHNDGA